MQTKVETLQVTNVERKIMELFNAEQVPDSRMAEMEKASCTLHDNCNLDCKKKKRFNKSYWFGAWITGVASTAECEFYEPEIDLIGDLFK